MLQASILPAVPSPFPFRQRPAVNRQGAHRQPAKRSGRAPFRGPQGSKTPGGLRGRLPGLVMAGLGIGLLCASAFSTVTAGRDAALADLDNTMGADAASHASSLKEYFERAQSIDLLLAHDSALNQFDPGLGARSASQTQAATAQAGKAMAYLQQLYPGRISEACLIDATGTERARVVRGKVAPASELSTQEAKNPFFAPTMSLPVGRVFQAAPYVSPDTKTWVISNSTPMIGVSGRTWGLAHFEVVLDTFRPGSDGADNERFSDLIVDNRTGRILLDSSRPVVGAGALGRAGTADMRAFVARPAIKGSKTIDGQRVAVARVPAQSGNANSWSVVVVAKSEATSWFKSIGPATVATALAALMLLAFAALNLRASQRSQRQGEARYRALINQSSDLVAVVDRSGHATYLSPSVDRLLAPHGQQVANGVDRPGETPELDFVTAVDPVDRAQFSLALQAAVPGRMSAGEFRLRGDSGNTSTFEMTVQDLSADPSVGGLVVTGHDVTDRLAMQREMEHRALHDSLTGLPNRALLFDRFDQALRGAERGGACAGLLLLDLDRFKEVNDTFGHHYGDELLRQIGPRLTGVLRSVDTIARLGGDEFAVLLPDVRGEEAATNIANALLGALSLPFHVEGVDMDVEASVGVVISGKHGTDPITLMQRADIAMYVAKTQHLGAFVYDPDLDGNSASKLSLVGDLRRALDRGELVLYYQPKVSVTTGDLVGAEALVRWQHPEHGLIFPDAFIPLAERTGLIGPLTHYVMNAAMAQAKAWIDSGRPLPIAVNLSARNLHDEGFADQVSQLLQSYGVPAYLFELEVTESAIMIDPVRARQTLGQLSDLGVRLSIDDFGAGYTSLSQLTDMPISEIKIDRSFVMRMADDPSSALIVSSVVELGHNLGMTLVAEGVESATDLNELAGLGCDVAQGYHLSRAIPAADFDSWSAGRPISTSHPGQSEPETRTG
jgi:diguanylate cyclase (GGDEF)-like protein